MTLSVTSAPANALAILQALSPSASSQSSSNAAASVTSTASTTSATSAQAGGVSTGAGAGAVQSLYAILDCVGQAVTTADAADAAGQTVIGLLQQMRDASGQAADPTTSTDQRAGLIEHVRTISRQIGPALSSATVNGANLVDGSMASGLKVVLGDSATASLTPVDLTLGGSTLGVSADASVATATAAASTFVSLGDAIGAAGSALSTLRAQADQISAHGSAVQTLGQALASPDQDGGDSVRLMALQLSQQLSSQPCAIVNQSPQSILSLFRS